MKKLLFSLLLTLISACSAWGQGSAFRDRVQAINGRALGGVTIAVCTYSAGQYSVTGAYTGALPCTPLISIFSDPALTQLITPPATGGSMLTDSNGNYNFWVSPANYTVTITGPQIIGSGYAISLSCVPGNVCSFVNQIIQTLAFSATPTYDVNQAGIFIMTLTGNVTGPTIVNSVTGRRIGFLFCQDGVGGRTLAWPASFLQPPAMPSPANTCITQDFLFDGVNWQAWGASGRAFSLASPNITGTVSGGASYTGITATSSTFPSPTITGTVAGLPRIPSFDFNSTLFSVTNTNLETTVYSSSIPANTIGTVGVFRLTLTGALTTSAGPPTLTFRCKYGGSTHTITGAPPVSLSTVEWKTTFLVSALGATNSQQLYVEHQTVSNPGVVFLLVGNPTASVTDSTLAQTLAVTVQPSVADAGTNLQIRVAILERVN